MIIETPSPDTIPGADRVVVILEPAPCGTMITTQYFDSAGMLLRQDKHANVTVTLESLGAAN